MSLCELVLQPDAAYQCIAALGETGMMQFRDLNRGASTRRYVNEMRRCDEMDRKLRFIENEIVTDGVDIPVTDARILTPQPTREFADLEDAIRRFEQELITINNTTNSLKDSHIHLWEMSQVIEKVEMIVDPGHDFVEDDIDFAEDDPDPYVVLIEEASLIDNEGGGDRDRVELKRVTGLIRRDRLHSFERLLWRMCNGAVFMRSHDCDDHTLFNDGTPQSVFVLFFSGHLMAQKVGMICRGSPARIYACPEDRTARRTLYKQIAEQLDGLSEVIDRTLDRRKRVIANTSRFAHEWKIKVLKMKMVFHTLDSLPVKDKDQRYLVAECWIPSANLEEVRDTIRAGAVAAGSSIQPLLNEIEHSRHLPPTHFSLNDRGRKCTRAFQSIVNAYGIPDYKEINPAPFTIITFPFLFAVMFGDVGHATIMLIFALALIIFEKKLIAMRIKDEIFNTFFCGRYIVLLMGAFSLYTGFIYNDVFGRSVNVFGSAWASDTHNSSCWNWIGMDDVEKREREAAMSNQSFEIMLDPVHCYDGDVGLSHFVIDPVWDLATNRLTFLNSMKMKLAVILGILQMTFGLVLSLGNHLHRNSLADVYLMFVPQLIFLSSIFGYLCLQIIVKWIAFPAGEAWIFGRFYPGANCAPSLLIGLINMVLFKNRTDGFGHFTNSTDLYKNRSGELSADSFVADVTCSTALWYPGQSIVELFLLSTAILSIPIMFFGKPLYSKWRQFQRVLTDDNLAFSTEEHSFGDIMIHQSIHTIEFVLGCISHTASYLRLWALSLAHAQLSEVLWSMLLGLSFRMNGWLGAPAQFVIVSAFTVLTVTILVLMEGLSAFLHALRLHWVEFQSKFYSGNGVKFEPFSFEEQILIADEHSSRPVEFQSKFYSGHGVKFEPFSFEEQLLFAEEISNRS